VTSRNKIIPDSLSLFTLEREKFEEGEMVWVNSVFNGQNYDKAYVTARDLAFKKEYKKSLLLCRYILSEVPGHIDSKILMARINAWEGHYDSSISILKECIKMIPDYVDSYAALFDVYFWSGKTMEAYDLIEQVEQNSSSADEVADKIARAKKEYGKIQPAVSFIEKTKTFPDVKGTNLN
jgi:tetratricopeptide (TPR) repeat protein